MTNTLFQTLLGNGRSLGIIMVCVINGVTALAQGTVTFDAAAGLSSTYYSEAGMWFQVVVPQGTAYDDIGVAPAILGPSNIPYNSTPYMVWFRQYNPYDYVALTNASAFGLRSVQLADPSSPSSSALPITFVGFRSDGSSVTNTFVTPGNGADHLLSYQFSSDFSSGLTSVDILASRWAMDNLVFTVPEPSSVVLAGLGLVVLRVRGGWKRRCARKAWQPDQRR